MGRVVVTDACALLNLTATGTEVEILEALGVKLVVHELTRGEVKYHLEQDHSGSRRRVPVDLTPLLRARLLHIVAPGKADLAHFVACCEHLVDSDALVLALSVQRNSDVLTDDKKLRAVASRHFESVGVVTTLHLICEASDKLNWDFGNTREVLGRLRTRANFVPPRAQDALCEWYRSHTEPPQTGKNSPIVG